ncbi:MAG: hypothetical protein R3A12_12440 [Ignavibacteria bacterium]
MKNPNRKYWLKCTEMVRGLSIFYLSNLSKIDIDKRIEADGIKYNSAY